MKILNLFLKTKNKNSLKKFFFFFNKFTNKNFTLVKKTFAKKKKKIVFTILKSPHVNKTAQEQFEIKFLAFQLTIITSQIFKFLIFFKKLKNSIFADINFKIKISSNLKKQNLLKKKLLNVDNFKTNLYFNEKTYYYNKIYRIKMINNALNIQNKIKQLIKLIDIYGHIVKSLNSSVGRAKD